MKIPQQTKTIFLLKVNKNPRTRCEICSKLAIKTPEGVYISQSKIYTGAFIVKLVSR